MQWDLHRNMQELVRHSIKLVMISLASILKDNMLIGIVFMNSSTWNAEISYFSSVKNTAMIVRP
jgi:hypothetical protein